MEDSYKVIVRISHYRWNYTPTQHEQATLDSLVNDLLSPLLLDCMAYNASVKAIVTQSGNYKIEAVCDQYATLHAMQNLLPEIIPAFK